MKSSRASSIAKIRSNSRKSKKPIVARISRELPSQTKVPSRPRIPAIMFEDDPPQPSVRKVGQEDQSTPNVGDAFNHVATPKTETSTSRSDVLPGTKFQFVGSTNELWFRWQDSSTYCVQWRTEVDEWNRRARATRDGCLWLRLVNLQPTEPDTIWSRAIWETTQSLWISAEPWAFLPGVYGMELGGFLSDGNWSCWLRSQEIEATPKSVEVPKAIEIETSFVADRASNTIPNGREHSGRKFNSENEVIRNGAEFLGDLPSEKVAQILARLLGWTDEVSLSSSFSGAMPKVDSHSSRSLGLK